MNYFNESFKEEVTSKNMDKMMGAPCEKEMNMGMPIGGCMSTPIYECPQERVCHRYICHEVPHVMPCNTRIINHHVFRHTFTPEYTCCEENVCENIYGPRCC